MTGGTDARQQEWNASDFQSHLLSPSLLRDERNRPTSRPYETEHFSRRAVASVCVSPGQLACPWLIYLTPLPLLQLHNRPRHFARQTAPFSL